MSDTAKVRETSPSRPRQLGHRVRSPTTGLVRGVKPWTAAILNFCPGHPAQVLTIGFFFAFALFPGGSYLLALAILLPMSIAMQYAFRLSQRR